VLLTKHVTDHVVYNYTSESGKFHTLFFFFFFFTRLRKRTLTQLSWYEEGGLAEKHGQDTAIELARSEIIIVETYLQLHATVIQRCCC
jgi:hypothetical protein